jgi:hypothetical protein
MKSVQPSALSDQSVYLASDLALQAADDLLLC